MSAQEQKEYQEEMVKTFSNLKAVDERFGDKSEE